MAQKKNYSRYFIILQENEKGYGIAEDKNPTGYVKLEVKAEKCKVSYYVQNLKKETSPYYIILICGKKGENKLIKMGEINIDDYGRTDISNEYSSGNLANTGIDVDKVCGAAIIKLLDSNIVPIMSGFTSTNIPKWKDYKMVEDTTRKSNNESKINSKTEENKILEQKNIFDKYEKSIEKSKKEKDSSKNNKLDIEHNKEDKASNIKIKKECKTDIDIKQKSDKENIKKAKEVKKVKEVKEQNIEKEEKSNDKSKEKEQIKKEAKEIKDKVREEIHSDVKEEIKKELKEEIKEELKDRSSIENKKDVQCKTIENTSINSVDDCMLVDDTIVENKFSNRGYICDEHIKSHNCTKVKETKFFKDILKDFEEIEEFCPDIKRCCWHKVKVNQCKDMYDISDFNKYKVVYYPMINYYSYICRYCHYVFGYKCDNDGNIKFIVYGVPGTKSKEDQPYGGKSGFVTWVPSNEKKDFGYWLMFYDFRSSTILIPIK